MRGQADLFLDYDAPLGPVETKLIDRIIIKARHQRETLSPMTVTAKSVT